MPVQAILPPDRAKRWKKETELRCPSFDPLKEALFEARVLQTFQLCQSINATLSLLSAILKRVSNTCNHKRPRKAPRPRQK